MSSERAAEGAACRRELWLDVGTACLLFLGALAWFSLSLDRSFDLRDEGFILYESGRAAAGEVPHRDFTAIYGPGFFLVNGLMLWLFDGSILPIRILLAVVKGGAVVLTFSIARLLTTRRFAAFGALLSIAYWGRASWNLNTPYAALYTIPLCLLAVFVLIRALQRDSPRAFVGAGLIAGAAILFKQSLGVFNVFAMILAVCAASALTDEPARRSRPTTPRALFLSLLALFSWLLAALAMVAPFTSVMSLRDYMLHFLPLHVLMGLVAAAVLVRGGPGSLRANFEKRLLPLGLGLVVLPGVSALAYGWWGHLDELIFNMFVAPTQLQNYYVAVPVPSGSLSLFMLGAIGLVFSALLALGGRRRPAGALAALALALMACARYLAPVGELQTIYGDDFVTRVVAGQQLYELATLWKVDDFVAGVQAPIVSTAALAVFAGWFFRAPSAARSRTLRVVIPLMLFQLVLCIQIFPRATYNIWQIQGALVPLLTLVLFRCYEIGAPAGANALRKAAAAAAVALLPLWMLAPAVQGVVALGQSASLARPIGLPGTEGIELDPLSLAISHTDEMRDLVAYLQSAAPAEAPLFLLNNEAMILLASRRATLFPERAYHLSLLGWGMLSEEQRRALDVDAMLRRLEDTPEAILISRPGPWSARLFAGLPGLRNWVDEKCEVAARIGGYEVLRRKPG